MNLNIDEEISEFVKDPKERHDQDSIDEDKDKGTKRGAPRVPEMWTRVISLSTDNLHDLKIFPMATDLLVKEGYPKTRKRKGDPDWECFFSPKIYLELHPNPDLEKMRLTEDRLRRYGEQVSKIRGWIIDRASAVDKGLKMDVGQLLQDVSHVEKKKWQRERKRQEEADPISPRNFIIQRSPLQRRRGSKRGNLTPAEKISIAHQALVQYEKYADIAKTFRTSMTKVTQIVQQVLKKKDALDEIHARRDEVEQQKSTTKRIVKDMVDEKVHIDSALTVQKRIQ